MGSFEILFNVAAFVAGLSLLERGAKLFVSSATTLAKRLHLPEMLVAILIAGAEWEELAVVALSLAQRRPALAVGNIIGSCVANIFGAFALGLVFSTGAWEGFDRSSKAACVALLALTSVVALFALADILWNRVVAGLLLVSFVVYVVLVLWTIWRAMFYTEQPDETEDIESGAAAHDHLDDTSSVDTFGSSSTASHHHAAGEAGESDPLVPKHGSSSSSSPSFYSSRLRKFHHTLIPILKLVCGFVALTVSGFILSHTSTHLAASFDMSDAAFGATVLSLATSLPEKFVAVMSSTRGHTGLLVADAVGSNVFLLTLCLGIAAWSIAAHGWHDHPADGRLGFVSISRIEAWWLWAAAVALTVVVAVGGKGVCKVAGVRQMLGALMLVAYGGFLAVEFTILRG
ncbi:hypothetical protein M406DRAFT_335529 [Cryphonectria parasitica EP155]|uniref:Sodium/calcium exchanger membrane region domain-containing protein n=1 Tax=Cryphonectria parasitica (strain ATCC 38755 / EP155) TaxID=660469 RepID=A0A9P4YA91_CRYP1|nr:uncharacterized protein M406DRAFT_335529 [Cryphonectria parasitica EP155]KAF3769693.1 hypothetical protein M406DRAFT_335529 [Cryphonectria parasitica EP155]